MKQIIYEPVWRMSLRNDHHRFRRLWCVYDPDYWRLSCERLEQAQRQQTLF